MGVARSLLFSLLLIGAPLSAAAIDLIPATAPRGAAAVLAGAPDAAPGLAVTFTSASGTVAAPLTVRTDGVVELRVPLSATSGPVRVTADSGEVATLNFTLTADPAFVGVSTVRASVGAGAPLKQPAGVALRLTDGTAYVADPLNHRIVAISGSGELQVIAGSGRPGAADGLGADAEFHAPAGVVYDASRNVVYVADTMNHRIRRIDGGGHVTTLAGSGRPADEDGFGTGASFQQPTGLAIDAAGNVYVADTLNHKIRKITPAGIVTTVAGSGRPAHEDGAAVQAGFHAPAAVAVLAADTLVVADTGNNCIRWIERGQVVTLAGSRKPGYADGPAHVAQFDQPEGVAVGESGVVFVADTKNNRIRAVTLRSDGAVVSTVAGTGTRGDLDGAPASATFNAPAALASAGALYVADGGNGTIRLVDPEIRLSDLQARRGPLAGSAVRLFGAGFVPGRTSVTAGGREAAVTYVAPTLLLAQFPAGQAGAVDVRVVTPASSATLASAYVYLAAPTLATLQPAKGSTAGGEFVTLRGAGFVVGDTRVLFGRTAAATVTATDGVPVNATTAQATIVTAQAPTGEHGPVDVTVITPGGAVTLSRGFRYFERPAMTGFTPAHGAAGTVVTITGGNFDPEAAGNTVRFGATSAVVLSASETAIVVVVPERATTAPIFVTTAGGTASSSSEFVTRALNALSISPASASLNVGDRVELAATATYSDLTTEDVTATAVWTSAQPEVAKVTSGGVVSATAAGQATITASVAGITATARVTVVDASTLPPDPATIAPPVDESVVTSFAEATAFLYTGPNAIQKGVAPGTIASHRVVVLRGRILTPSGAPLSGVRVTVHTRPEFGETLSRADGWYDLAVNGGGALTVHFEKAGVIPAQRAVTATWNDFEVLPDVVLVQYDTAATRVDLAALTAPAIARASAVADEDGTRRATMVVMPGTAATMILRDGTRTPLSTITLRATEFTVGPNGRHAMPAPLPPTSAYTYCVELSADEAVAAAADGIEFSQPLYLYVENFLRFRVGEIVPSGYFDRRHTVWVPSENGFVMKVLGGTEIADIDLDGDGSAEPEAVLASHGFTVAERRVLARTYGAGVELWRAPVRHFTPHDLNFPMARRPPLPPPPGLTDPSVSADERPDDTCTVPGSVIECENQTLRESIPLAGSGFGLTYSSARAPGRTSGRTAVVHLTGAGIHADLVRVELRAEVGGRETTRTYAAAPNLRFAFEWDGKDAYGRTIYGTHLAKVAVTLVYRSVYASVPNMPRSFGAYGTGATQVPARAELHQTAVVNVPLVNLDDRGKGLGGWSLDIHHNYDAAGSVTSFGDGSTKTSRQAKGTVRTIVGPTVRMSRNASGCADGLASNTSSTKISFPESLAVRSDGGVYFADACQSLRLLDPEGRVSTVVPVNSPVAGGSSTTYSANDLAIADDGSVYMLDKNKHRILRLQPSGALSRFAGTEVAGFSGDGGLALDAQFQFDHGSRLALGPDRSLYVNHSHRIRRIQPDGRITTVAGTGSPATSADGVMARNAPIAIHSALAVGPAGEVYFFEKLFADARIRVISPEGALDTFATLPPSLAAVSGLAALKVTPEGDVYFSVATSGGNPHRFSIARFSPTGEMELIADGNGGDSRFDVSDIYFAGEGGPATNAAYGYPRNIALAPDRSLLVADTHASRIRRIALESAVRRAGSVYVPTADGSMLHEFDEQGRHLRTTDALTRVVLYEFSYDANRRIAAVKDADGRVTTFAYAADGVTIVSPAGEVTKLAVSTDGYLSSVSSGVGTYRVAHDATGLLQRFENPRGNASTFLWHPDGRLLRDTDAAGGFKELSRVDNGTSSWTVTTRTAEGKLTTYERGGTFTSRTRRVTNPGGLSTLLTRASTETTTTTAPSGVTSTSVFAPDFRFGMTAPLLQSSTVRMPSGKTLQVSQSRSLQLASNLLFVNSLTDTVRINGRAWTSTWTFADRTMRIVSPAGRTVEQILDVAGRVGEVRAPGVLPTTYTYDALGRPLTVTQGTRTQSFSWNDRDELISMTDPGNRTVTFAYDAAGRVGSQKLPGGRTIELAYDANGNVVSLSPPARAAHAFTYDAVDLGSSYAAPAADAAAAGLVSYRYDRDRALVEISRPSGAAIAFGYDPAGRPSRIASATRTLLLAYDAAARLSSLTTDAGPSLAYSWDGSLPTQMSWSGDVRGTIAWDYDSDFRPVQESVNGTAVALVYDADSLLRSAGSLQIQRDAASGRMTGTALGTVTDAYSYDQYGSLTSYVANFSGTEVFRQSFARDDVGRIVSATETAYGAASTRTFGYDAAGRLATVTRDGAAITTYTYDANGNRLTRVTEDGTSAGHYDGQDRLLTYGGATYSYTADGDLLAKTDGAGTTAYRYDAFGNLQAVTLPDGTKIEYVVDGQNRRVGKKVNGALVRGWLYADQLRIVAELDGAGNVVSRFVYASRANVPDYMIRGGVTYRILSDHLGSPRLVLNTTDGSVAQMIGYTEFGEVLADTNPTFQPFTFAGGLSDADTRLVRFGARDYDPRTGRWTTKEPLGFGAGDTNFYAYAFSDPVNLIDPNGLYAGWDDLAFAVGGAVVGVGGQALSDAINGDVSGFGAYGRAALGGAVGGVATLYGGPAVGGAVGAAATNTLNQWFGGSPCGFDFASLATDTLIGAATGRFLGASNMSQGVRRGSVGHVYKTQVARLRNRAAAGLPRSVTPRTAGKMFAGAVEEHQIPLGTAIGVAASTAYSQATGGCGCP